MRAFFTVAETGSINRAAVILRLTQPALSRQMKALEDELGGPLLVRDSTGVKLTALGHLVLQRFRPVLAAIESAMTEVRRQASGTKSELRIGYLTSAAPAVLTPALNRLRAAHPELVLHLHDMSPREQLAGLRSGELDVALIGQEGAGAADEFYRLNLRSFGVCAAVSAADPLAGRVGVSLRELKTRPFIGIDEREMPGRNRWQIEVCRAAGFKPRFATVTDGITHVLSQVVSTSGVTLLPDYFRSYAHPGVVFVTVTDPQANWDFLVLWQRGKVAAVTRKLIAELKAVVDGW